MFQYLGLVLVPTSWVAGVYIVQKWHGTNTMSISKHAASTKGSSVLFASILGIGGALSYWWLIQWLTPHLKLGTGFVVLLSFTATAQIVVALVPDTTSWRHKVHYLAAYTMACLYVPLSLFILSANKLTYVARVFGAICLAWMLVGILLFLFVKKVRPYYLILQSSYIVAFQLIILLAAYLR